MSALTNENSELIEQFVKAFQNSAASLLETGKILVRIAEKMPDGIERVLKRLPQLRPETIKAFLKIGRGEVDEVLMLAEGPGVTRLRACDITVQRKHATDGIPVLISESGKTTHLMVSVFDMTSEQAVQVFHNGSIRTLEQQRQWLQSRKPKIENAAALRKPYTVRRGRVDIHGECSLTVQQLLIIAQEAAA